MYFDGDEQVCLPVAQFYLGSVCLALSHLHQHNVAHRNVKSENVLIDDGGHVKLSGFSLAKTLPYTNESGVLMSKSFTVCGTAEFMAPEIVLVDGHNTAVDAWALGVLACELLTGTTPFASAGEVTRVVGGKRRCFRCDNSEAKVMNAIAETHTKGVRLPVSCAAELAAVPGGTEVVLGLLSPSPLSRTVIPTYLSSPMQPESSSLLGSKVFAGLDWVALRHGSLHVPYVPPRMELRPSLTPAATPTDGDGDEAAMLLRRKQDDAVHNLTESSKTTTTTTYAAPSAAKAGPPPSYLDSTAASRLGSVTRAKREVVEDEDDEEKRNQRQQDEQFFHHLAYNGNQAIFADF